MSQLFFSKLIDVCEQDWIPEQDALFGERCSPKVMSRDLKRLIYRHKNTPRPSDALWTVKGFRSLLSRRS